MIKRFYTEDPFNWHVPQRNETMSLATISQRDVGLMSRKKFKKPSLGLITKDIEGKNFE